MVSSYTLVPEPDRDLLRITMTGFFDMADLAVFDRDRHAAYEQLRCKLSEHLTLIDVRDLKIQAQAVFESFRVMISDPKTRARRLAFVTGDAAIRIQVRRMVQRDDMQCFVDTATAEAWLTAP